MDWIYLDNNATTRPAPEVLQAVQETHERFWANPSSVHRFGQMVRHRIDQARAQVAAMVNCQDRQLVFTSGGTESNNLALRGVLDPTRRRPNQAPSRSVLITAPTEHAAVREPAQDLAQRGVLVVELPVDRYGQIQPDALAAALNQHATGPCLPLVSIQWANNETGIIQPIEALVAVCGAHRPKGGPRVLVHVDATQAVGKIPVDVGSVPVDLLTLSAHKFHGPKGIGALFMRDGVRVQPQTIGGPQERQKRGGTEHTAGIVGLGVAADLARAFLADAAHVQQLAALRDRFEQGILQRLPQTVIHAKGPSDSASGPAPNRLWNTASLGFEHLSAEAIIISLSEQGLCASAGAACSSGSLEPSPVLLAMGVPEPVAHGSVRFSLSRYTTDHEIDQAIPMVIGVIEKLAKTMPLAI